MPELKKCFALPELEIPGVHILTFTGKVTSMDSDELLELNFFKNNLSPCHSPNMRWVLYCCTALIILVNQSRCENLL